LFQRKQGVVTELGHQKHRGSDFCTRRIGKKNVGPESGEARKVRGDWRLSNKLRGVTCWKTVIFACIAGRDIFVSHKKMDSKFELLTPSLLKARTLRR